MFLVYKDNMLFSKKENGQGLVEYALILMMIAVVVIVYFLFVDILGNSIRQLFQVIIDNAIKIH